MVAVTELPIESEMIETAIRRMTEVVTASGTKRSTSREKASIQFFPKTFVSACFLSIMEKWAGQLLFQILIEPFDREFDRLVARLAVDAVVRNVGDGHVFLFRPGHPVVGELSVIFVIEQLFLLGDDEQHRRVLDLHGVLHRRELEKFLADGSADESADRNRTRRGVGRGMTAFRAFAQG